ncbi:MAG: hypothetical protein HUJ99_03550, partial [Bacteroidaceae bacterium]|nr:hypothetical protein [Bacteroidaceae bacterium]
MIRKKGMALLICIALLCAMTGCVEVSYQQPQAPVQTPSSSQSQTPAATQPGSSFK